ncbi:HAD family hydrolase [Mucilaginibacter segetis]|uniref:HAD family phosphatase n=1 Tax=Mucilaginibacter segetis TaxID=2793071 RepID=A0A934PWW1_9SPHI|nr:HAD family phosphatase [Mucilaginibacter segetis]MBK0380503.1 HAD family phosphatase [Mucilaginibacter segetis]
MSKSTSATVTGKHYLDTNLAAIAVIFDMDGTLIDNTPFHYKAWELLFKKHDLGTLSREKYLNEISGVPISTTVNRLFGDIYDESAITALVHEKQLLYQQEFKPYLQPVNGLENFLADLKNAGIKMAVATSSDMADVNFIFNGIPLKQYFDIIITGDRVSRPKPDPQIFLKAAEELNTPPQKCVVFEDSVSGLKAANSANMKVVGITTAHPANVVSQMANLVINDYADINVHKLTALFD